MKVEYTEPIQQRWNDEVLPPDELLRNYWQQREALDYKIDSTLGKIQELLGIKL